MEDGDRPFQGEDQEACPTTDPTTAGVITSLLGGSCSGVYSTWHVEGSRDPPPPSPSCRPGASKRPQSAHQGSAPTEVDAHAGLSGAKG